jgi:hypothetical protein
MAMFQFLEIEGRWKVGGVNQIWKSVAAEWQDLDFLKSTAVGRHRSLLYSFVQQRPVRHLHRWVLRRRKTTKKH